MGCATSPAPAPPGDPAAALAALARDYWQWQLREKPEEATTLGDHRYDDRLTDLSEESRTRRRDEVRAMQRRLETIAEGALAGDDRVTWEVLRTELDQALGWDDHGFYRWDMDQMYGPQVSFAELAQNFHPRKTDVDRTNLRKRYLAFGSDWPVVSRDPF